MGFGFTQARTPDMLRYLHPSCGHVYRVSLRRILLFGGVLSIKTSPLYAICTGFMLGMMLPGDGAVQLESGSSRI